MTGSYSRGRSRKYPYYHTTSEKERQRIRKRKSLAHTIVDQAIAELSFKFKEQDAEVVQEYINEMIEPKKAVIKNLKSKDLKLTKQIQKIEEDS